jgi:seryl-tRNA synthetase
MMPWETPTPSAPPFITWEQAGPYITALIAAGMTWLSTKIQHRGKPENALIDQLQEQISADRAANKETTDAMKQDIKDLKEEQKKAKKREQVRDNYIIQLREHINAGNPPPPPAWPEGLYD